MRMYRIQTLNRLSPAGLARFPAERYVVGDDVVEPDAVLLRSLDLHATALPSSLKAVARAGVGVNNIPLARLTECGIPVFYAPGANANAVKELVLAGMLLAARNLLPASQFAASMEGSDEQLAARVEREKNRFLGFELAGRVLAVLGLGAVGVRVANAAQQLGMRVAGYDPDISVQRAWQLSAEVRRATSLGAVLEGADFVTLHVPLVDATRHLIDGRCLAAMRKGSTLLNFAREAVVDEIAVRQALDSGQLHAYVSDFPREVFRGQPRALLLPHLGASTREAEDNCTVMVVDQLRAFLEHGAISNSVNFPDVEIPQVEGYRLAVVNANVPNMLGQISTTLANAGYNIIDMLNRSRGEIAYTLADVDLPLTAELLARIAAIDGVLGVRAIAVDGGEG